MTEPITQTPTEEIAVQNNESRSQERIKQLSEKVELTSKERDEKDRLLKEQSEKIAQLERENSFNSGFADVLGTQPAAKDFKDDIKSKVLAGYSVEDATFAVLGKAGKLGAPVSQAPKEIAGGSAPNAMSQSQKEIGDMTQSERREALEKSLIWT